MRYYSYRHYLEAVHHNKVARNLLTAVITPLGVTVALGLYLLQEYFIFQNSNVMHETLPAYAGFVLLAGGVLGFIAGRIIAYYTHPEPRL